MDEGDQCKKDEERAGCVNFIVKPMSAPTSMNGDAAARAQAQT
jgi:hypothetical protein